MEWILIYIVPFLLASDTFFLSISGGVTIRPYKSIVAIKTAVIFTITLGVSAFLAFQLAQLIKPLINNFSNLVGHILILFTGIRLLNDARKIKNEDRTFLLEDYKILFTSALALSFLIFLAFFGLGFIALDFYKFIIPFSISIFFLSFLGVFIGSHYQPIRLGRSSKFAAGLLLSIFIIIHYTNLL